MSEERHADVRTGVLPRVGSWLSWAAVLEVLLVVTSLPGFAAVLFVDRSPGNVPLVALCLVPLGPSLAATVFAWHRWLETPPAQRDMRPAATFFHGYAINWRDVLLWWVPVLAVLAVLAFNVKPGPVGVSTIVSIGLAAVVLVLAGNALVLTSLFSFRTRDIWRLAPYYLAAKPVVGIGVVGLLVVAAVLAYGFGGGALVVLASTMVCLLTRAAAPMADDVRARFTGAREGEAEPD